MDRIILEVDDNAAKKWRYTSQEKKNQLSNTVNRLLNIALEKSEEDFSSFLDRFGRKAEANGLTEDVLNKLLNEE